MNKMLWIMMQNKEKAELVKTKYLIDLVKKQEIIGFGEIDASNYDPFFKGDNCFWVLISESTDFFRIISDIISKIRSPLILRLKDMYYNFNMIGSYDILPIESIKNVVADEWKLIIEENDYEKNLDSLFNDSLYDSEQINKNWENDVANNDYFSFEKSENENSCASKGGCENCNCSQGSESISGEMFESISLDLANKFESLDSSKLCDQCFSANCSCEKMICQNCNINPCICNEKDNQKSSECNPEMCGSCSGCDWDVDIEIDEIQKTNDLSHHFECPCEDNEKVIEEFVTKTIKSDDNSFVMQDFTIEDKFSVMDDKKEIKEANEDIFEDSLTSNQIVIDSHQFDLNEILGSDVNSISENEILSNNDDSIANNWFDFGESDSENFDEFSIVGEEVINDNIDEYESSKLDNIDEYVERLVKEYEEKIANGTNVYNDDNYYEPILLNEDGTILTYNNQNDHLQQAQQYEEENNTFHFSNDSMPKFDDNYYVEEHGSGQKHEDVYYDDFVYENNEFNYIDESVVRDENNTSNDNYLNEYKVVDENNNEEYVAFDEYLNSSNNPNNFNTTDDSLEINEYNTDYNENTNINPYEDYTPQNDNVVKFHYEETQTKIKEKHRDISSDLKTFLLELQKEKDRLKRKREEIQKNNRKARELLSKSRY